MKKELLTTFALPAELVVQHDNQMTLLTPWANCIYTHSVPVPAEPSVDYTIVCFVEVQNKSYILTSKEFNVKKNDQNPVNKQN